MSTVSYNTPLTQVYNKAPDDVRSVLIGSKSDMKECAVSRAEIRQLSELYCMDYFSTSAKLNSNIGKVSAPKYNKC